MPSRNSPQSVTSSDVPTTAAATVNVSSSSSSSSNSNPRNGISNPLESESSPSDANGGRIWFSAVMPDDSSTTPVTTPGDMTTPQQVTVNERCNRSSRRRCHRGRVNRLWGMQGHWKDIKSQHGQWTCFLCCHVRTGTIVIGSWHMLLHLMALSLIAVVMIHPEILNQVNKDGFEGEQLEVAHDGVQDVQAVNCSEMPCLLATQGDGRLRDATPDFPLSLGNLLSTHRLNAEQKVKAFGFESMSNTGYINANRVESRVCYQAKRICIINPLEDVNVALFITLCTFIVTLLLVYGAFREQPSHLMPFFFLQVFDFCISSMTMFGYLSYLPNVRQVISESPVFPFQHFQNQLLAMNTKCLTFFVMLIFITTFLVKAYCISIVWRCYKYLMQRSQGGRWPPRSHMGHSGPVDQESQTLVLGHDLPDYDTAITDPQYRKKVSGLFPEPPPSYDMAMAAFYAQQHIISQAQAGSADEAPLLSTTTAAEVNENHPSVHHLLNGSASSVNREDDMEAGPSNRQNVTE
ncbi:Tetraspanning orphan receptor [Armadillidium vulgare]|nr:Tetraspanning orphan receptor [Armadillidium vulgare]